MRRMSFVAGFSVFAFSLLPIANAFAQGQPTTPLALSGVVSSAEEGVMEGVLVSAEKQGSTITITVVRDRSGHYSFPASKLGPGQYDMRIRAVGYDLDNSKPVTVAADKTATQDIKLKKTEDLAAQLTNGEWLDSIPGTNAQKGL